MTRRNQTAAPPPIRQRLARATSCRAGSATHDQRRPLLICEHCGGRREVLALITDPKVIHRILSHLGYVSPVEFEANLIAASAA